LESITAQRDVAGHDTPIREPLTPTLAGALHAGVAELGSVVVIASPRLSIATHSEEEAHDTPVSGYGFPLPSGPVLMVVGELQVGDAAVGSVEITLFPASSTATHSEIDGHDTPARLAGHDVGWPQLSVALSMCAALHVPAPPVGLVETTAFPALSTATQSDADGHEIPVKMLVPSMLVGALHVGDAAVGSLVSTTFPRLSTAAHNDVDAHDTAIG
jgi:hypothetical protein